MKVFWLATGAAIGYVLGAKAGRERYEQIMTTAREWADKPVVADTVDKVELLAERGKGAVVAKLSDATDAVTAKLSDATDAVTAKLSSVGDTEPATATSRPKPIKATPATNS